MRDLGCTLKVLFASCSLYCQLLTMNHFTSRPQACRWYPVNVQKDQGYMMNRVKKRNQRKHSWTKQK